MDSTSLTTDDYNRVDTVEIVEEETVDVSCPCPPTKSYCTYTNSYIPNFWEIKSTPGLFYNCTCKDGFYGEDGWRCEKRDACTDENWKCAPKDEGGYCVGTAHDDVHHPFYKCGCRDGFKEVSDYEGRTQEEEEDYLLQQEQHGVLHCVKEDEEEEAVVVDNENRNLNVTFTTECYDEEKTQPSITSINVIGGNDPSNLFSDKDTLEQSIKVAYEKSLSSQCYFRSLENVTLLAFYDNEEEEIIFFPNNDTASRRRRYLVDENEDDNYMSDADYLLSNDDDDNDEIMLFSNSTNIYLTNDDDEQNTEFSYNFTLFFSLIMRCYGCPDDALLFDDASRRRQRRELEEERFLSLRGRKLQQQQDGNNDNNCVCELDDGTIEDSEIVNVAPSRDIFVQEFNNEIIEQDIESIEEVVTIKDEPVDYDIIEEINNDDTPTSIIEDILIDIVHEPEVEDDTNSDACQNECNTANQYCGPDGKCWCQDGYFAPSGRGGTCRDIQECDDDNACARNAHCIELEGSYDCKCNDGYYGDGFNYCTVPTISSSPSIRPTSTITESPTTTTAIQSSITTPIPTAPTSPAPVAPVVSPEFFSSPEFASELTLSPVPPTSFPVMPTEVPVKAVSCTDKAFHIVYQSQSMDCDWFENKSETTCNFYNEIPSDPNGDTVKEACCHCGGGIR